MKFIKGIFPGHRKHAESADMEASKTRNGNDLLSGMRLAEGQSQADIAYQSSYKAEQTSPAKQSARIKKTRFGKGKAQSAVPRQVSPSVTGPAYTVEMAKARERKQKKVLRQHLRDHLLDFQKKGEQCDKGEILQFISRFRQHTQLIQDLIHEDLDRFDDGSSKILPFSLILHYTIYVSEAELDQHLADYQLSQQLDRSIAQVQSALPDPLVIAVVTTEYGPDLSAITAQSIYQHIIRCLNSSQEEPQAFTVEIALPFPRLGDYTIRCSFPLEYSLQCVVRLVASDELPPNCRKDLQHVTLLPLPETGEVIDALRGYRTQMLATRAEIRQTNPTEYVSRLGALLVTAYHYGYGRSPLAQEVLDEWGNDVYAPYVLGTNEIREILQQHNTIRISQEQEEERLSEEDILTMAREFFMQNPRLAHYDDVAFNLSCDITQSVLTVGVRWRGAQVGEIRLQQSLHLPQHDTETELHRDKERAQHALRLDQTLKNVLSPPATINQVALLSHTMQELQKFCRQLRHDLALVDSSSLKSKSIPQTIEQFIDEARLYHMRAPKERAEHFRQLTRIYAERQDESLLRCSLAEYCFATGKQYFHQVMDDARQYLQLFLFLHEQMSYQVRHHYVWACYIAMELYSKTYGLGIELGQKNKASEIGLKFHTSFVAMLSSLTQSGQFERVGACLVEIAAVNTSLVLKLIVDSQQRHETQALTAMTRALQESHVLRTDLFTCLWLLFHVDPLTISRAMTGVNLQTVDGRRHAVSALLWLAHSVEVRNLVGFTSQVKDEVRTTLAFSFLVEPFMLNTISPEQESRLKARLIAEALRLSSTSENSTLFIEIAAELSLLFDRFSSSLDLKDSFGIAIQDKLRFLRKGHRELGDLVYSFINRTQAYVTAELAKQIRDTDLAIGLVSDRALHSTGNTRVTIEVRNIGDGNADNVELEVLPAPGQYWVEEQQRRYKIEMADKVPVQKEIFIQPLVGINEKVDLSIVLHYDTLKQKNKLAVLSEEKRSVWFYSASEFRRIPLPYNFGEPATELFYGRHDLLEGMADNLRPGRKHDSSMIVYGLKRAGKTSIVRRFIDHTLEKRDLSASHISIFIDLQKHPKAMRIKSNADFLYFLLDAIIAALAEQGHAIDIQPAHDAPAEEAYERFAQTLDQILQAIGDRHLLIVLDEFSTLYGRMYTNGHTEQLTPELFSFLSNTIQSKYQFTIILIGTYILLKMMRGPISDLAKICTPRMISFLDKQAARQLIEKPVRRQDDSRKGWLEYDEHALNYIVTHTHSHPYTIQYLCSELIKHMNVSKYNFVTINDVTTVLNEIIMKPAHDRCMLVFWDEFSLDQQKVLACIANQAQSIHAPVTIGALAALFKKYGEQILADQLLQICFSLADSEMLEKCTAVADAYTITIPLYQMWLRHNKPVSTLFDKRISD